MADAALTLYVGALVRPTDLDYLWEQAIIHRPYKHNKLPYVVVAALVARALTCEQDLTQTVACSA